MGKKTRSFIDGEIIFREGEEGDSAFVIKRGQVALSKDTSHGPVEIEVLEKGKYFGEMGILNGGQRTLSAVAVGDLSVEIVGRKEFEKTVKKTASQTHGALTRAVPRLRQAGNAATATGDAANSDEPATPISQNWFSRLFSIRHRATSQIEVRIVPLIGENGDQHARKLLDALSRRDGLNVRVISADGPFSQKTMPKNIIAACSNDGHALLQKSGGDLLIWGDVSADHKVFHLHFSSLVPTDEDLPGAFNGHDMLPVPAEIPDEWSDFLYATVLSATALLSPEKARVLTANMETALEEGAPTAQKPPREFTTMDRAHLIVCLAHTLATTGQRLDENELLQLAGDTYRRANDTMPDEEQGLLRGMVQKNLGGILAVEAEHTGDISQLRAAADAMGDAIDRIPRRILPREWAAAQNRLGQILYRLDLADATADTGLLTKAIAAFHAAVQVYTRVDAPRRWADVMNNYAQAAQILGGQLHDPMVLQKAVSACRNALEVRRRDRTPFPWAATQNTLGSALFLMGKITHRNDHLVSALDAFKAAHEVYVGNGAARMADVIARNMEHVQSLLSDLHAPGFYGDGPFDENLSSDDIDEHWWRNNVVDDPPHQALG